MAMRCENSTPFLTITSAKAAQGKDNKGVILLFCALSRCHHLPNLKELVLDGAIGKQPHNTSKLLVIATENLDLSSLTTTFRVTDRFAWRAIESLLHAKHPSALVILASILDSKGDLPGAVPVSENMIDILHDQIVSSSPPQPPLGNQEHHPLPSLSH